MKQWPLAAAMFLILQTSISRVHHLNQLANLIILLASMFKQQPSFKKLHCVTLLFGGSSLEFFTEDSSQSGNSKHASRINDPDFELD